MFLDSGIRLSGEQETAYMWNVERKLGALLRIIITHIIKSRELRTSADRDVPICALVR
jgi:hypothetical protein